MNAGEGSAFADAEEVHRAYHAGQVILHAKVKVRIEEHNADEDGKSQITRKIYDTTVGRALLYNIVPKSCPTAWSTRRWTRKRSPT